MGSLVRPARESEHGTGLSTRDAGSKSFFRGGVLREGMDEESECWVLLLGEAEHAPSQPVLHVAHVDAGVCFRASEIQQGDHQGRRDGGPGERIRDGREGRMDG